MVDLARGAKQGPELSVEHFSVLVADFELVDAGLFVLQNKKAKIRDLNNEEDGLFFLVSGIFLAGCATNRSSVIYPVLPPGLKQAVPAPELMRKGRLTMPQFPAVAVKQHIQGGTCFRFVVEANGKPSNIEVVDSQPAGIFDVEAQRALSQWLFVPDKLDGNAVRSLDQGYCLDFKLN